MSDVTEQSLRISDADLAARKAIREHSPDTTKLLNRLWALRCDGELTVNFSHALQGSKRDHLWTVVCNADRTCAEACSDGMWEYPRPNHAAA